ncbi:dicarboxylate transporter [Aspergillus stella-maris]|uniref:dicarboxylate transporter n=1 Tax=Aspergillus stella-maris TaxID=1810926 RepID=UPI003CCE285D
MTEASHPTIAHSLPPTSTIPITGIPPTTKQSPAPSPAPTQSSTQSKSKKQIEYPLWFGGSASCMAVAMSHPLDLIKVRMQMADRKTKSTVSGQGRVGMLGTAMRIVKSEGVRGLYAGFSAGFMRQLTYGTTRLATYESLKNYLSSQSPSHQPPNALTLSLTATLSGMLGSIPGNAADIANIRMQNDMSLPPAQRRNYRHILHAWSEMYKSDGPLFWVKGMGPNAIRCGVMTGGQLGGYDFFKSLFVKVGLGGAENTIVHFSASVAAAFVATSICSPMDVVKTQLMGFNQGSGERQSVGRVVLDLTGKEGVKWMVRGWVPSFVRLGPQTVATLVLLEEHKRVYKGLFGEE